MNTLLLQIVQTQPSVPNSKTIAVILSIVCFIIIFLVAMFSSLLREAHRENKPFAPYSFSRVQLWLWTLIVIPLFVLNWGYVNPIKPGINETSLVLLSISGATSLTSGVVAMVLASNTAPGLFKIKLNNDSKGFFYDILTDDNGQFSIGRLQNLVFTLVFAVIYITYFFSNGCRYIDFERYVYVLMGISSGTYLFGKAMRR